jgi:molecular chaperone GrpE
VTTDPNAPDDGFVPTYDPAAFEDAANAADSAAAEPAGDGGSDEARTASVEQLIVDLEEVTTERDQYLDQLRRNQADFENARKRLSRAADDAATRAVEHFAEKLLPVLDACESAIGHGATEVEPIFASLLGTLEKEGLARVAGTGDAFDPNVHEAVFHEEAGDGDEGTVVSEVLRTGYTWKERMLRPAMVKVRG